MNHDENTRKIIHLLNEGLEDIPVSARERLAKARALALENARRTPAPVAQPAGQDILSMGNFSLPGFSGLSAIKMAFLATLTAVIFVWSWQQWTEFEAARLADIDAVILSDDAEPDAINDPGFDSFLKSKINR